uniref:Uncharacterized protein n=1 Tax=Timema cristinae TaxID=61476 RepID=A0A7R9CFZ6_TIMCR|nr:unnamed protein product [Timema cristinae]
MIARLYHPLIGVMTVVLAASGVQTTTVQHILQRCSVNSTVACLGPRLTRHLNSVNETSSRERAEDGNGEGTLHESILKDFKQLWLPHKGNHFGSRTQGDLTSEQRGYLLHRKMMVPLMIGIVLMMKSIIPIVLSKLAFMGISSIISSKLALFLLAMLTLRKMFFSMDQHEQHSSHYSPSLPHLYDPHHGVSSSDNKRVYITRGRQLGGDDFWKTSLGKSSPTQQTVDVEDDQIEKTPRRGSIKFVDTHQMYSNRSKEFKQAPIQIAKRRLKKKPQREIYSSTDKDIHHQDEMLPDETSDGFRRLVKRHPNYLVESDVSDLSSHQSDWRRLDGIEEIHLD